MAQTGSEAIRNHAAFIWSVADRADSRLAKLHPEVLAGLADSLALHVGVVDTDRRVVARTVDPLLKLAGLSAPQQKTVWEALAVRDPEAPVVAWRKGEPEPDPELRDQENVALPEVRVGWERDVGARLESLEYRTAVEDYLEREVHPYVSDVWADHSNTKIGYEIPLTRHFFKYVPPRPLDEIDAEIKQLESEIQQLLHELIE